VLRLLGGEGRCWIGGGGGSWFLDGGDGGGRVEWPRSKPLALGVGICRLSGPCGVEEGGDTLG
jgi:hypothetical protein